MTELFSDTDQGSLPPSNSMTGARNTPNPHSLLSKTELRLR